MNKKRDLAKAADAEVFVVERGNESVGSSIEETARFRGGGESVTGLGLAQGAPGEPIICKRKKRREGKCVALFYTLYCAAVGARVR
jgi:hypothetical protein